MSKIHPEQLSNMNSILLIFLHNYLELKRVFLARILCNIQSLNLKFYILIVLKKGVAHLDLKGKIISFIY